MSAPKITRRTMLKGMLGGFAISVALPPLEMFMNRNGTAYAGNSGFPTRFGTFYWGNGCLPDLWVPAGNGGPTWTPSPLLMPLAALQSQVTVVSGMNLLNPNTTPHSSGPAGLFTGADIQNGTYVGPTFDQIIANQIGSATRFPSLEVGVESSTGCLSATGPNAINPIESNPMNLYTRLFVDGFRLPGSMAKPDPKILLRQSVLGAVTADANRLSARLGSVDRARLDQHLTGIRDLESQLAKLEQAPPNLAACALPAAPLAAYPDINGRAQMSAISTVVSNILALALACDMTRVFTNMYSQPVNNVLFPNATEGHHQLTHDEPDPQPQVEAILTQVMTDFAYFLSALQSIPEGDGTLLDHTVVLCTTDCSLGKTHSLDNYPILLCGGANGQLNTGIHYHSASGENACLVSYTLMQVMGVRQASFGVGPSKVTSGLPALMAS